MRIVQTLSLVAIVAAAACDDDQPQLLPTAPLGVASNEVSAFIAVSNPNPAAGSEVTVWVRALRGTAVGPIGSFTIRLAYDSTRLQFKEAGRSAQGMVMANGANAGVVVAAGASAEGFKDDELLATTFVVTGAAANVLSTLALTVNELNSVTFADQTSALRVERGLYRDATSTSRK
jgi:hypothetical protein